MNRPENMELYFPSTNSPLAYDETLANKIFVCVIHKEIYPRFIDLYTLKEAPVEFADLISLNDFLLNQRRLEIKLHDIEYLRKLYEDIDVSDHSACITKMKLYNRVSNTASEIYNNIKICTIDNKYISMLEALIGKKKLFDVTDLLYTIRVNPNRILILNESKLKSYIEERLSYANNR